MSTIIESVSDAELSALPEAERALRMDALVRDARRPVNGELVVLEKRIAAFEYALGMSSAEMRARLSNGSLQETDAVCRWLMTLSLRDRLAAAKTPTRWISPATRRHSRGT